MPERPIPDSCRPRTSTIGSDARLPRGQPNSAGTGSALPFLNSSQLRSHGVHPLPYSSLSPVPSTVIGSPIRVLSNSQRAFDGDTLTHPCDTLRRPWAPTDHGAEWT